MSEFDDFATDTREVLELMAARFTRPDDDFDPRLIMKRRDGVRGVAVLGPLMGEDDPEEKKDRLAAVISALIVREDAVLAAYVSSAWAVFEPGGVWDGTRPAQHPKRVEMVTLVVGDAKRRAAWLAPIVRAGGPPTLGEWTHMGEVEGRFAEAIARGFEMAAEVAELAADFDLGEDLTTFHRKRALDKVLEMQGIGAVDLDLSKMEGKSDG